MLVTGITCLRCKDFIFSRAGHDFHWCSCGAVAIDGGFDYIRICGNPGTFEVKNRRIKQTRKQLNTDWNLALDQYGIIPEKKKKVKK